LLKLIHCEPVSPNMKQGGLQVMVFTKPKIKVFGL